MICAAADVAAAEAAIEALWGEPQPGAMPVPLSPTGGQPPTHFGSSGTFEEPQIAEIEGWTQGEPIHYAICEGVDQELPGFEDFASSLGLTIAWPPMPEG